MNRSLPDIPNAIISIPLIRNAIEIIIENRTNATTRLEVWRISKSGWPKMSAFLDMQITLITDFGEQNKVAIRWTLKATYEKDFAGSPIVVYNHAYRDPDNLYLS